MSPATFVAAQQRNDSPPNASAGGSLAAEALVGVSHWVKTIRAEILRIAPFSSSVLISGPSGTGKELVARAIHFYSPRAKQPYVAVDCAAINGALFASQVFGHVKGAFTGAAYDTIGCFRAANGGTVLIDEIGELELECQAKLLRVLQERAVTHVGGHTAVPINVRIIAATNRDLTAMVAAGRFREDLFYRLNVISLKTVPLKDRPEDIAVLAEHILAQHALRNGMPRRHLPAQWLECLQRHDWPGNVRELENFLERIALVQEQGNHHEAVQRLCANRAAVAGGLLQGSSHTSELFECSSYRKGTCPWRSPARSCEPNERESWPTLAESECQHIARTLEHAKYNQTVAARLLGISRRHLCRKIRAVGLDLSRCHFGRPPK
jgi:DNA-binding NtrC family response regulator